MPPYAIPTEVRPLLGNITAGITDAQINLAIDAATDRINTATNRQPPNDWQDTEANWDLIKQLARLHAALEVSIGIGSYDESRKAITRQIEGIYKALEFDPATDITTDFVDSSVSQTYAASPTGIIWSTRYPNLRKSPTGDNAQYSFIYDVGG